MLVWQFRCSETEEVDPKSENDVRLLSKLIHLTPTCLHVGVVRINNMDMKLKEIATGNGNFKDLITGGSLYVDKTMHLYNLVGKKGGDKYFFLSRPRRFGKSLTISTLESIFKGEKELFKGTYIYDKYSFESYPVIRISMNSVKGYDIPTVTSDLKDLLFSIAISMDVYSQIEYLTADKRAYAIFARLLEAVSRKYQKKVVVLI